MIGVSLPYAYLTGKMLLPYPPETLLPMLREKGVESIELRAVAHDADPTETLRVAALLWNHGFHITVHGGVNSLETAVSDIFIPLSEVLTHLRQDQLTITIHPLDTDNAPILTALADFAAEKGYPVQIALENNRLLPDKTEGDCAAFVLDAVTRANRKNVGICFDFGHYAYYLCKNHPNEPLQLPGKEFFSRVIHTHIHALYGFKTHFPLDRCPLPLSEMLKALDYHYFGVCNIEPDFPRIATLWDPMEALFGSIDTLKNAMPFCIRMYDDLRLHFDRRFLTAASVLTESCKGTRFGLVHASSYLFSTNGYAWGVDLAFRHAYDLCHSPAHAADILRPLKLILLSHVHGDHFEAETVRQLAKNDLDWVVPDFMVDDVLACGIPRKRMHIAAAGQTLTVGPLTIRVFSGRHYRPGTNNGTPAYGYHVSAADAPSLVFPGDTRDYRTDTCPDLPPADYCFAHVWLGDNNALDTSFTPVDEALVAYMLRFSRKNIVFGHLYENGRTEPYTWTTRHAQLLANIVAHQSPDTNAIIPLSGDVMQL